MLVKRFIHGVILGTIEYLSRNEPNIIALPPAEDPDEEKPFSILDYFQPKPDPLLFLQTPVPIINEQVRLGNESLAQLEGVFVYYQEIIDELFEKLHRDAVAEQLGDGLLYKLLCSAYFLAVSQRYQENFIEQEEHLFPINGIFRRSNDIQKHLTVINRQLQPAFLASLQNFPHLSDVMKLLKAPIFPLLMEQVHLSVNLTRVVYYKPIIKKRASEILFLANNKSKAAINRLRKIVINELLKTLEDYRNLLHLVAIVGDVRMFNVMTQFSEMPTLFSADKLLITPLQYARQTPALKEVLESLPYEQKKNLVKGGNLNCMNDISEAERIANEKIFEDYANNFCIVDKIIEKMNWLRNIEYGVQTLFLFKPEFTSSVKFTYRDYMRVHDSALALRAELADAVGYPFSAPEEIHDLIWVIDKADQVEFLRYAKKSTEKFNYNYVICIEEIEDKFRELLKRIDDTLRDDSIPEVGLLPEITKQLGILTSIIKLELACIQAAVIVYLRENIIERFLKSMTPEKLSLWEMNMQENKTQAMEKFKTESRKEALTTVYNLLEKTIQAITVIENFGIAWQDCLAPLLYETDPNRLKVHFNSLFDHAVKLKVPIMHQWKYIQPNLLCMITEVPVEHRRDNCFEPLRAKYQIKFQLDRLLKIPDSKKEIIDLCYLSLVSDSPEAAEPLLKKAGQLIAHAPDFWLTLEDAIRIQINKTKLYERKAAFDKYKPHVEPALPKTPAPELSIEGI